MQLRLPWFRLLRQELVADAVEDGRLFLLGGGGKLTANHGFDLGQRTVANDQRVDLALQQVAVRRESGRMQKPLQGRNAAGRGGAGHGRIDGALQ